MEEERTYTAFAGEHLVAAGGLRAMLGKVKSYLDDGGEERVLIFEDWTGRQVDFDFRGTPEEVLDRADPGGPRTGPGRPKLGVVAREVTLLPRHWEWLERQPSGASAALRRLVDEARKREPGRERARLAREAASKVMWAMAGDLPNFEEASRALFGRDQARFEKLIAAWPKDLRKHLARLVREAAGMEEEPAAGG
ncbi:MAG: hypothetical protein BGO49_04055 [Planctomycetales bacterium 71-10]|nr:MAG: hypothetical protein BGO49_04055 [Planctomycetales bacterium 71-10]